MFSNRQSSLNPRDYIISININSFRFPILFLHAHNNRSAMDSSLLNLYDSRRFEL